jgi:phage terminase large subunit
MPDEWFQMSGLEEERLDDKEKLTRAQYDHKWMGQYLETVENAIISPEWFDAAIDAHVQLGFEGLGAKIASHDPSDTGPDAKGYALRHGSVVLDVRENPKGDVNEGCDWALDLAIEAQADQFVWDCDGMGVALKRPVEKALAGKKIEPIMFKGSESPERPEEIYQASDTDYKKRPKTNKQTFKNNRAQKYIALRDRFYNTYQAIVQKKYIDPDTMISISSSIDDLAGLRSEVCRIPLKPRPNLNGLIQIASKVEMKGLGIESPNRSDALMMLMIQPEVSTEMNLTFDSEF